MPLSFYHSPDLAWSSSRHNDRLLKTLFIAIASVALLCSLIISWVPVPDKADKRGKAAPLPPRYAKFIFTEKKRPKAEVKKPKPKPKSKPKKVKPKPQAKPKPKKKTAPKPKPKPVKKVNKKSKPKKKVKPKPKPKPKPIPKTKPQKTTAELKAEARANVRKKFGGLFSKSLPVAPVMANQTLIKASAGASSRPASSVLTTEALSASEGIEGIEIAEYTAAATQLAELELTTVESSIDAHLVQDYGNANKKDTKRSHNSIRQVFDRQKGRQLYPLYQRFLRKDPSLKGTIILRITISPAGEVLACDVVSNGLNNAQLAKRLVARVKKFDFGVADAVETTVNYPMEFSPPN